MSLTEFLKCSIFNKQFAYCIILIALFFKPETALSQLTRSDSIFLKSTKEELQVIKSVSTLDPKKAAIFSAVLPGMGQAYNNQYWKIPIIYGGGIIFGHYIHYNNTIYNEFRNALIADADNDPTTENPYSFYNRTALTRNRDAFRRNRDMLMLITAAFYFLNIVDAHVSAHLHEFEVNENLSLKVSPTIQSSPVFSQTLGFSISLNIK